MPDFDFSTATVDDFKVAGQEPQQESEPIEDVSSKIDNAVPEESVPTEVETPSANAEPAKVEPKAEPKEEARGYNFKDDFIKGVVEFYEKTGDLTPYLQAKTIDFEKMSDEEILRRNLREQYSELSDSAFDRLYKQQVVEKYKLDNDEWSEDEAQLERELMKVEASKIRSKYIDWQKGFRAPEPEADNSQNEALELMKKFEQDVLNHSHTKSLLENKKISLKTPDGEFNFEVPEAESLLGMTLDNDRFFAQFANEQGQLDYDKWYKVAAYSSNPEVFERSLINYGKALGRQEVTKEIKNPSISLGGDVPTEDTGDFNSGLLNAFLSRGKKS